MIEEKSINYNCLIIDFIGWENTYYIALNSGIDHNRVIIQGGAKNSPVPLKQIETNIKETKKGAVILKKGSLLYVMFMNKNFNLRTDSLEVKVIYEKVEVVICEFDYK